MASSTMVIKSVCLVVVCMVMGARIASAAISCGQVVNALSPCVTYVSQGGAISPNCCTGIKNLNSAARTTADRQSVCTCLKQAVSGFSFIPINVRYAAGLPGKCGVNLPYKIDPSTNCDDIQ